MSNFLINFEKLIAKERKICYYMESILSKVEFKNF